MIPINSSVWVDSFHRAATPQADRLDSLLGVEPLAIGDMVLTEVLRGFISERDFGHPLRLMMSLTMIDIGGQDAALQAARHFQYLRALGVTVRKTIAPLIATRCILGEHALLYSDFDPFLEHLGLQSEMAT